MKEDNNARKIYYKIQSVHQEESDTKTTYHVYDNVYPQLPLVYRAQDRYRALYDLILNPLWDTNDPPGGAPQHLLSKIVRYREGYLCNTSESDNNGQTKELPWPCQSSSGTKIQNPTSSVAHLLARQKNGSLAARIL